MSDLQPGADTEGAAELRTPLTDSGGGGVAA